uniref:Transmembrane protein n=1 Tax=Leersia perrieri TaxID=77586 RepID=A0A0D9XUX6_9ORYZ
MATPINLNTTNVNDILDLEIGMGNTTIRHTAIQEEDDEAMSPHIGTALMGLFLYYIYFVYYMVGTCEIWWHAALAIGAATALVLLSFHMAIMQTKRTIKKSPQPDTTQSDLSRRLLPSSHK